MPAFTSPAALRRLSRTGSLRTAAPAPAPPQTAPASGTVPGGADRHVVVQPALGATPVSPAPPPPSSPLGPLENDSIVLKAVRAYERDRKRAKKTKERTERERERERERLIGRGAATDGRACRHCRDGSGRRTGGAATPVDVKEDTVLSPPEATCVEEIIADVVEREGRARGELEVGRPLEVHLEALAKPGKSRRSKTGEFELIPGMPVVIALEDHAEEAELDEPWEHISADELDEKRVEPRSYATIVASTA
ncbi:hypothetical protein BV20DRAFT_966996 [Pilatotrama ljubarskyi]|nr:hypothetical protein BV20DRAFT_966996 [Pilatotrama ljubarskyi]